MLSRREADPLPDRARGMSRKPPSQALPTRLSQSDKLVEAMCFVSLQNEVSLSFHSSLSSSIITISHPYNLKRERKKMHLLNCAGFWTPSTHFVLLSQLLVYRTQVTKSTKNPTLPWSESG